MRELLPPVRANFGTSEVSIHPLVFPDARRAAQPRDAKIRDLDLSAPGKDCILGTVRVAPAGGIAGPSCAKVAEQARVEHVRSKQVDSLRVDIRTHEKIITPDAAARGKLLVAFSSSTVQLASANDLSPAGSSAVQVR